MGTHLQDSAARNPASFTPEAGVTPEDAIWQLQFQFTDSPDSLINVSLRHSAEMGIAPQDEQNIDLRPYGGVSYGVSRRHLKISTTNNWLCAIDMGSTNGTRLNDGQLQPHMPYPLKAGDRLTLGRLNLVVRALDGPEPRTQEIVEQADLLQSLADIAKAITSKLELDEILRQVLDTVSRLTGCDEGSVWLVDQQTNDLFLEAERGIEDENFRRMRLPVTDPHVSMVMHTRKPVRASRLTQGFPVKIKTGYLVDALLYMPLIYADEVLGVLAAAHRQSGWQFTAYDERIMALIADFVSVAIQNARRFEELQATDRRKTELIEDLAHEFRTPLTYIAGYTSLLADNENLRAEQTETLELVLHQTKKLSALISRFVTHQAAEESVELREPLDIAVLLDDVVRGARIIASENKIRLETRIEAPFPEVSANVMAITQVVDNLVYNAFKFTPEGGTVTLSARWKPEQAMVEIATSDTGIGMSAEAQERVFDRYYQAENATQSRYAGQGIGLAICRTIVEAHGGQIAVKSAPGHGTTFTFTLPVRP